MGQMKNEIKTFVIQKSQIMTLSNENPHFFIRPILEARAGLKKNR